MLKKWILIFSLVLSLGLVWAQGLETFDNLPETGSSYADGTFLGQDGSTWTYTQSRSDYDVTGNSLMLARNKTPQANVYSGTIANGIGVLNFNYMQAFGTNVNLNVLVNDVVVGNVTSSSEQNVIKNSGDIYVNVSGDFVIKFINVYNSSGQVCIDDVSWTAYSGGGDPPAEAPAFSPVAGTYNSIQYVSLSSTTPGASIYYTLDGSAPTDQSEPYLEPIEIAESTTIKAIAFATGYLPSPVAVADYVIEMPQEAAVPYIQNFDADLGDTYVYSVSGATKTWYYYASEQLASVNGHNSGDIEEDWLILPSINMNENDFEVMSFDTWGRYGLPGVDNYLKLFYSTDYAGIGDPTSATWTEIAFTAPPDAQIWQNSGLLDLSAISGTSVHFGFKYYSVPGNYTQWQLDNISIINLPPSTPILSVNPSSISGFSYLEGEGPSAAQMFSVTGENLSENIVVQAPANYEISSSETTGFSPTITLTQVGGAVAETPLYARLEAGLGIADYNNELITVNSAGAMEVTISLSGSVTGPEPFVNILQRPAQINLADSAYESAVLVEIGNYPTDDVRYRLYNGGTQYYPWDDESDNWISSTSYSSGPLVPGTATSSTSWWILFQVGSNPTTSASYRDRLGPTYSANYQTQALPAATSIVTGVPILNSQVNFNTFSDYSAKNVVLAYDASETLIAAASTNIGDGAFTIWVEDGTTISRIEVRDVLNNLIESVTGTWPQVLNPQIILTGEVEPLFSVEGLPSEEITSYYLSSDDLTQDIAVVAPNPFEISTSTEGPWGNTLDLTPSFEGTIYIRLNSPTVGTFAGDITHNSPGATEVTLRVEGETLAATGEIIVVESLLPFSHEVGTPSATQSYSLSATDLDTDITITSQAPFEVSQDGSTGWATVITVPGTYNGLIYVRMNADAPGDYNDIDILHSNPIASPVTITVSGTATAAGGVVDDIFFSEYLEGGSGNNKYIEIYNATDYTVDLSRYQVELYSNGASTISNIEILSGNLLSGEVLVIANSDSVPAILDEADIYSTVCYFNGNDALILRCLNPDTVVDVIGTMGTDPGTGWDVAGTTAATANHVLVRKPTVSSGNADWAVQAGTDANNSEWIVHPDMYLDDLGIHTYNPGALITPAPVFNPAGGLYAQAQSVTISCANPEAEIRYSTDGTDPSETVGTLYTDPIPVSENTTIKAIAYAPGYDPSIIVEAVYTFVTPISDIATLRTQPTGAAYSYTLTGEAVLTFQQSTRNQKYIQDATAAIVIDDNAGNITTIYNLYDGITGITGYLSVYGGLVQFIPTADPGAASSTNNVVIPEVRTLASLTSADQAKLIKVMDTTISGMAQFPSYAANLTATDASGTATLRTFPNADYAGTDVPLDPVNLICLVGEYNGSMQVSPRFLSDIETSGGALDSPIPSISLNGANVVLSWNVVDGASSYRIEAADDPYGTFTTVDTTTNINYSVAAGSAKKFYRIIALP